MSSEWKRPNSEPDFKGQANSFISNLKMIQALLEKRVSSLIEVGHILNVLDPSDALL